MSAIRRRCDTRTKSKRRSYALDNFLWGDRHVRLFLPIYLFGALFGIDRANAINISISPVYAGINEKTKYTLRHFAPPFSQNVSTLFIFSAQDNVSWKMKTINENKMK